MNVTTFLTSSKVGNKPSGCYRAASNWSGPLRSREALWNNQNVTPFSKHSAALHCAAMQMAQESIRAAGEDIKRKVLTEPPDLASTSDPVDIVVSVDDTWQRHGFSSLYGVLLAIPAASGKVVDFTTVKSRVCVNCQRHLQLDPNSNE